MSQSLHTCKVVVNILNDAYGDVYTNNFEKYDCMVTNKSNKCRPSAWISPGIIKLCDRSISTPLTHVLNLSLSQGHFPRELKIARIIPLLKSGDPMIFSNYRPVSVLPAFSKIYERIMYNRLIKFLNDFDILYDFQFGFRTGHSPNIALVYLVDKIIDSLNNGKFVIGFF